MSHYDQIRNQLEDENLRTRAAERELDALRTRERSWVALAKCLAECRDTESLIALQERAVYLLAQVKK